MLLEEVGRYCVSELGIDAGAALGTALDVQLAHLPEPSRTMPQTLSLPHDFAMWHETVLEIRAADHQDDWEQFAPRLHTFPPGEIKVSDPNDICHTLVGKPLAVVAWNIHGWDMKSSVARAS